MNAWKWCIGCSVYLVAVLCPISGEELKKPTFPDVFQVEVQGVFVNRKMEVDGSMFYDKTNNRAAIRFLYQGVTQKLIYKFNDDEFIQIEGTDCQVSKLDPEEGLIFFPFTVKDNKKIMATPEEALYFTNSTLDEQVLSVNPSYVYIAKLDIPAYGRKDCNVTHIFSKPEVELPDCDGHACKPTLVSISLRCPAMDDDRPPMEHSYNFFRFRSTAIDPESFQAPEGVFCNSEGGKGFPEFPPYFSFSYDLLKDMEEEGEVGLYAIRKRIWYDSKLSLIRMDEFDNDGIITSSRIFDFYGGNLYSVVSSFSQCESGPLDDTIVIDKITELPQIFFKDKLSARDPRYVGVRKVQGVFYEVWSNAYTDTITDALKVEDFYFTKILPNDLKGSAQFHISHVHIYTYERNYTTRLFELSVLSRLTINNFRSVPKEWEAFDVSSCFNHDQKVGFKLKVDGPSTIKESRSYEEILEKMYMRLIITTNVSVIRINELTGVFDASTITEFTGWILNKTQVENSETGKLEPDMHTAYRMIEDAAIAGKLTLKLKKDGKDIRYVVTAVEDIPKPGDKKKDCYSGGSLAAASLVLLILGFSFGVVGYYVFLKKRRSTTNDDKVYLEPMS
ncbi:hypothetical protein JTE90_001766 [Oedothorax gibbosus]|uniref:LolA-like domain-containing protein n=1 Tax=Oedothorax gibbosus TaxID=931172 RepID=A0AAV6VSC1_9ARAC|nr:hypothetical protein JTE90_001766 [Oedothorax gibbosus]